MQADQGCVGGEHMHRVVEFKKFLVRIDKVQGVAHQTTRRGAHKNIQAFEAEIRSWGKDRNDDSEPFI